MSLTVRFPRPSAVATRPAGSCVDTTAPARRSWSKNSFKRTTNWRPRRSTAFPWAICEATCISRASGQLRWSSQTTSSTRQVQSHVKQAVGTGKILAVLAVDAHHHALAPGALSLDYVHCIGVSVADSWTGETIADVLQRLIAQMGRPAAYLKDGGSDLHKAVVFLGEKGLASPCLD